MQDSVLEAWWRRPTVWVSGNGEAGEAHTPLSIISGKPTPFRAAESLSDWSRC